MSIQTEQNKATVIRFNRECLEKGNKSSLNELVAEDVINYAAAEGMPNGKESFSFFLKNVLHQGFSDIEVEIFEQLAEGDLVSTRKIIRGTHTGEIAGILPTGRKVEIKVIDIIRLRDGQYVEHWGMSNFDQVLRGLS
ncbi:MAG: ester cyclase [Saprospiraceae bacterium]|nr:ester cyclase [Lewinella sp.]